MMSALSDGGGTRADCACGWRRGGTLTGAGAARRCRVRSPRPRLYPYYTYLTTYIYMPNLHYMYHTQPAWLWLP